MAPEKTPKPERNYVTYKGPHPHCSVVDLGIDFTRDEPVGPLDEETIKLLTREGKSKEFVRSAAPAPRPDVPKSESKPSASPAGETKS
jgi:hypothetical protein